MYNCKRSNYRSIRKKFEGLIGRRIVLNEQQSGSRKAISGVRFHISSRYLTGNANGKTIFGLFVYFWAY